MGPSTSPSARAPPATVRSTRASRSGGCRGAVQRIGLVEHRQHLEPAGPEEPLDGDLRAGDERLDEQAAPGVLLARAALRGGVLEELRDPPPRGDEPRLVVRPDDAAARREDEGLQDARVRDLARRGARVGVDRERPERRDRHARVAQRLAHGLLVRGPPRRGRRVVRQPEPLRRERRDHGGGIARGDDPADRALAGRLRDLLCGVRRVAIVEREEVALLSEEVLDPVAPVAPDHERDAQPSGRRSEVVEPVARGGHQQEQLAAGIGHGVPVLCGGAGADARRVRRRARNLRAGGGLWRGVDSAAHPD
jgi:hypothetical protein